jgi:hypothetical protein
MKDLLKKPRPQQDESTELVQAAPARPALGSLRGSPSAECSGWKSSATDPLHPNSSEINVPSGVAE